jgi:hypothetical protein
MKNEKYISKVRLYVIFLYKIVGEESRGYKTRQSTNFFVCLSNLVKSMISQCQQAIKTLLFNILLKEGKIVEGGIICFFHFFPLVNGTCQPI